MKPIGTFTEEQCQRREDKAECERIRKESGGKLRYFVPKFHKRKGQTVMEVYAMTTDEYAKSNVI